MQNMDINPSKLRAEQRVRVSAVLLLLASASAVSYAQTLPVPSRTVYKCNVQGMTTYSDAPCMGAERLEIAPSRGVGKSQGSDVRRERHRELLAEAIRPLTGMDAQQLEVQGRRMNLPVQAQRECRILDTQLPEVERAEARASASQRELEKLRLLTLRQRQRDLRC